MKKCTFALLACLAALNFQAAPAAILTWDITPGTVGAGNGVVTGGAGSWNTTGTNGVWTSDGGVNNVAWTNNATAPHSAIFGGGSGSPIAVTVGTVNVQDITFNATVSGNYSLSGGTITLGNTTAGVNTPTPTITANVNASIGSVLAGNDGLIKTGGGTLTLTGANTFTGGVTVNGGNLIASSSASLGSSGTITVNTGGTLTWAVSGYNTFPSRTLDILGGTVSLNSAANNAHNYTGQTLTMQGGTLTSINGPGGAANDGGFGNFLLNSSTLVVSGSAQSTISTTTFATVGASSFSVGTTGAAVDLLVQSSIVPGGGALTKNGAGKMVLTGANTYITATNITSGVLNIQHATALGTIASGTSVTSGAALEIQGGITVGAEALTLNGAGISNGGALRNISGTNTYGGLVTLGSDVRINSDSGQLTLSNTGTITGSGFGLTLGGAGNLVVNSVIGTGAGSLTKDGGGTMTLAGNNTYTGATTVNQGVLNVTGRSGTYNGAIAVGSGALMNIFSASGLALGGNLSGAGTIENTGSLWAYFQGAATQFSGFTGTLKNTSGSTYLAFGPGNGAVNTKVQVDGGNFVIGANGSGAGTWQIGELSGTGGSVWAAASGSGVHTLQVGALNTDSTYAGVIRNLISGGSATTALTKVGSGSLTLTGANVYTGSTTVSGGTLKVAAGGVIYADAYQPSAVLTVQSGGFLELNNWDYDQSVAHTQSLGGLRANSNAIVVNGGTIRITGATPTSYTRGFTIGANGATLEAAAGANWTLGFDAATPVVNSANGDLTLTGAGTGVFDKVLSGSAAVSLTKSGAGSWTLTAANTYAGGTQISGGTLFVNNSSGSATGTGAVSLLANATLAGSGSISGLVTTAAPSSTFSPGNSPGTLSLLGGLNAAAGATFNFELGTISDQINLGSSLFTGSTSANGLRFIFSDAGGLTTGVTYTLLTFGLSSNLDYGDLFILSKPSGVTLDENFGVGGWLINGNNLQVQFMVVPEPSTSLLLALGLVGIGYAACRRAV